MPSLCSSICLQCASMFLCSLLTVQESQTCSVVRTPDRILMDSFTCIMISIASSWYPHLTLSFNTLIKEGLAPSMNILHLSVFTLNQISALHVPEEKQKKDSMIR